MLVLTRKAQQRIQIGDNITITVVRVKGQSVRVGIEAPNDVRVIRGELQFDGEMNATFVPKEKSEDNTNPEQPASKPSASGALRNRVAALTERVRVDAFQRPSTESFNPADHRMEMSGQVRRSSPDQGPRGQAMASGRAVVPMNLSRVNPR